MPEKLRSGPIWFHLEIEDCRTFPKVLENPQKTDSGLNLKHGKCSIQTGRFRLV
jgi:hypothetical protein